MAGHVESMGVEKSIYTILIGVRWWYDAFTEMQECFGSGVYDGYCENATEIYDLNLSDSR